MVAAPASNAEFLKAVFGPLPNDARPTVCMFAGRPDLGNWTGHAWRPGAVSEGPALNCYFTLAVHRPDAAGRYRRTAEACAAVYGVLADDIGTKAAPRSRLDALPPSVLIQTSEGNYQALYLFDAPVTDLVRVDALQAALIAAGLCDPDAKSPATRYCRMPFGVNGKHAPPHLCRLVEWSPHSRYTIDQIRQGLALPELVPKAPRDVLPSMIDLDAMGPGERDELIDELRSALKTIPMDDHDEFVSTGQNLCGLGEAGFMLWIEAISKSAKYDDASVARWESFDGKRSDYRAVFNKATAYGWINPRSRAALDPAAVFATSVALPAGASLVPLVPLALGQAALPFIEVDISDLAYAMPDPQVWWCESYVPAGHVTLLGGHGGAGKSTLALMLAVCIALGWPFMGLRTRRGRVLFFSAEDQGPMVRRRLQKICRETGADPATLAQTLHILDATEADPALFIEHRTQGHRTGLTTATHHALATFIEARQIDVVFADNASDVFDGDEINRALVRGFIRSLALLVRRRNGAVLLLAHVDKQTSRAGKASGSESYSGSTAWHNSVRSRLFLLESGPGMLELQHQKSNLGPRRAALVLAWLPDRLPQMVCDPAPGAATPVDTDLRALLSLIAEFYGRGAWASAAQTGRPNVPQLMGHESTYPKHLKKAEVFALLEAAHRRQLLKREEYPGPDRKPKFRWALTAQGLALIASEIASLEFAASAPSAAST